MGTEAWGVGEGSPLASALSLVRARLFCFFFARYVSVLGGAVFICVSPTCGR